MMNGPNNPIGWCDYTWNPVSGCLRGCTYCYARQTYIRYNRSFAPTFHESRINDPAKAKTPARIFVCSVADLFGNWIPDDWIVRVIDSVRKYPRHTFLFLTKDPKRYCDFSFPSNSWLGTTVESSAHAYRIDDLIKSNANVHFISFEPLLDNITHDLNDVEWVIIGPQTQPMKHPDDAWVKSILDCADKCNIPVFMKDALKWEYRRREFPSKSRWFD